MDYETGKALERHEAQLQEIIDVLVKAGLIKTEQATPQPTPRTKGV